jgi:hypothetical protein
MTVKQMIFVTCIALGLVISGFCMGTIWSQPKPLPFEQAKIGGNIDIEYYLEVSEDSIWIENYETKRVYGGKYSDLDSLINVDNL